MKDLNKISERIESLKIIKNEILTEQLEFKSKNEGSPNPRLMIKYNQILCRISELEWVLNV